VNELGSREATGSAGAGVGLGVGFAFTTFMLTSGGAAIAETTQSAASRGVNAFMWVKVVPNYSTSAVIMALARFGLVATVVVLGVGASGMLLWFSSGYRCGYLESRRHSVESLIVSRCV
jgi:hypothetical protein